MDNAVRIYIESNFDLRNSSRSRRKVHELKLAKSFVELRHFTFTLENMDFH